MRLTAAIVRLAAIYGRYGYRRITALLRSEGWTVNAKRVEHLASGGAKSTAAAAQAGSFMAERRIMRAASAALSWPCLELRLCCRPHSRRQGVPDADGDR
ncbi:transposase [Sphingomonas sp. AP4-R1]|nr:transposase [Sphingomonas sp. AP4-R1]